MRMKPNTVFSSTHTQININRKHTLPGSRLASSWKMRSCRQQRVAGAHYSKWNTHTHTWWATSKTFHNVHSIVGKCQRALHWRVPECPKGATDKLADKWRPSLDFYNSTRFSISWAVRATLQLLLLNKWHRSGDLIETARGEEPICATTLVKETQPCTYVYSCMLTSSTAVPDGGQKWAVAQLVFHKSDQETAQRQHLNNLSWLTVTNGPITIKQQPVKADLLHVFWGAVGYGVGYLSGRLLLVLVSEMEVSGSMWIQNEIFKVFWLLPRPHPLFFGVNISKVPNMVTSQSPHSQWHVPHSLRERRREREKNKKDQEGGVPAARLIRPPFRGLCSVCIHDLCKVATSFPLNLAGGSHFKQHNLKLGESHHCWQKEKQQVPLYEWVPTHLRGRPAHLDQVHTPKKQNTEAWATRCPKITEHKSHKD